MIMHNERTEFCQLIQDDYVVFVREYHRRRRHPPTKQVGLYPPEPVPPYDHETAIGWRAAVYTLDGHVERAFPFKLSVHRVVGGMFGGTAEARIERDHGRYWPLRAEFAAECDHECRPLPHPTCGCGVYASPTPAEAAAVVRAVLGHADEGAGQRLNRWRQLIVYPVVLTDVYERDITKNPRAQGLRRLAGARWVDHEYVAAHAKIAGPILATSEEAADDLQARGFAAEHAADLDDLPTYLERLA